MVPMVATMDGTRPIVTSAPLMQSGEQPGAESDRQRMPAVPTPCAAASPIATEASAMIAATEMSISPAMMSSASGKCDQRALGEVEGRIRRACRRSGSTARPTRTARTRAPAPAASIVSQRTQHAWTVMARRLEHGARVQPLARATSSTATRITDAVDERSARTAEIPDQRQTAADDADEQAAEHDTQRGARFRRRSRRRRSGRPRSPAARSRARCRCRPRAKRATHR